MAGTVTSSPNTGDTRHPRDRFITVYGRKPVLNALLDTDLVIDKVVLAHNAGGDTIEDILDEASRRDVHVERANESHITKLARNGRQHQGALADIVAPRMDALSTWLSGSVPPDATIVVLDGLENPANVGMIIRSAVAAGVGGIVLPRRETSGLTPVVIKASGGVAFGAEILRCETAEDGVQQLRDAGFHIVGLAADAEASIYDDAAGLERQRTALVMGNESIGHSDEVRARIDEWRAIPMPGRAESLNVACAATVVLFELVRRRDAPPAPSTET